MNIHSGGHEIISSCTPFFSSCPLLAVFRLYFSKGVHENQQGGHEVMSTPIRRILAISENLFQKVYIGGHELKSSHVHPYQTYFSHFIILGVHVNTKNKL